MMKSFFPGVVSRSVLVALSCLAVLDRPAYANDWTNPVSLSTPGQDISNPHLVVSNDGTAVVVWVEEEQRLNPSGSILYAIKTPQAKTFSASQVLFSTGDPNGIPNHEAKIAIDGSGNAIIVWLYRPANSASEDIFYYAVKPSGATAFGPPQPLPRTGVTATRRTQFDFDIAANESGVFWVADPMFLRDVGKRIVTWKGTIAGFAEAEFASPNVSSSRSNDRPLLAVTPDGNAYLYYQSTESPTKAFASFHNGTSWFDADSTLSVEAKGIQIGTGGSITDGRSPQVVATADGAAIYTFREDATYALYTRASAWTTDGTNGSTNATAVKISDGLNYAVTSDSTGNGLAATGNSVGGKGGVTYHFVNSQGIGKAVFLKSPSNDVAGQVAIDMDPAGNAVMAFGTSSTQKKNLYLAYRPAGATKKFTVEDTIPTPKGILPQPVSIGFGSKNTAVAIYTALSKSSVESLYVTIRTNKKKPAKGGGKNKPSKGGNKKPNKKPNKRK